MTKSASLKDFFEEPKVDCQISDHISKNYLSKLKSIIGSEKAIDVATTYTLDDLFSGETILDKFNFVDSSKEINEKFNDILKILNWEKELDSFTSRDYYLENLTDTFKGFEQLNERLVMAGDRRIRDWFFFRDVLCGVTRNLLSNYGVPLTNENKSSGHVGKIFSHSESLVLPGLSTDKLLDFLISKEIEGTSVDECSIVKGFDNCITAMEVASKRNDTDHREIARLYVDFGFTSLEKVNAVDANDLKKVKNAFDLGDTNSGTEKRFKALVYHPINGNKKQLEKFLKFVDKPQLGRYLYAFDSINNLNRFFSEEQEENRPSPESILYARKIFKTKYFEQTVKIAKQIDSPLIKEDIWSLSNIESGEVKYKDLKELTELTIEYQKRNTEYKVLTGNKENLNNLGYERLKKFNGDLRFLRDAQINLNEYLSFESENVMEISNLMTFEEYENLGIISSNKQDLVSRLISSGYTKEEIKEAFSTGNSYGANLEEILNKVNKKNISLNEIRIISNMAIDEDYALSMISNTSAFREQKLLYELIPGLHSHGIKPEQLGDFVNVVNLEQYKSEKKFDALSFIKDITFFYNKPKIE